LFVEQVNQEDNQRARRGAALGAAAGFVFLGPLGAAAGAALGGFIGYGAGNDLETCRQGVKSRLSNDVTAYADRYCSEVQQAIDISIRKAISDLGEAVETHLAEYGEVVGKAIAEHREKERQLAREIRQIHSEGAELNRRKQKLETLQANLIREART